MAQPASTFDSVAKLARVGVWVLFNASAMVLPYPPVYRSTKFGTLPAAMRRRERGAFDRGAINELIVGPDRSDGGHFVDDNSGWGCVAQHRQESDGWIVTITLLTWLATFGNQVQDDILARSFLVRS